MHKPIPILLAVTLLLIISLACGSTNIPITGPTLDMNGVETAIMETSIAAASQTAGAIIPVDMVNLTATLSPEPSFTPTATLSPTPLFTDTPAVPIITVSLDTNCRIGPGKDYDRVGALMVGEVAEVLGHDPTWRYWYIKNPDQSNGYCWLWGEYATISGNVGAVPLFTPPPTPTAAPDFQADFVSLETCAGWWVNIQLTNIGGTPFKSISLTVRDMSTNRDVSMSAERFTEIDGCHSSNSKDILNPGERYTVSSGVFPNSPRGHRLRATITLCAVPGQVSTCTTKVIKFTP